MQQERALYLDFTSSPGVCPRKTLKRQARHRPVVGGVSGAAVGVGLWWGGKALVVAPWQGTATPDLTSSVHPQAPGWRRAGFSGCLWTLHLIQKNMGTVKPWDRSLTCSVPGFLSCSDAKKSKPKLTREVGEGLLGNLCVWTAVGLLCAGTTRRAPQSPVPVSANQGDAPTTPCSLSLSPLRSLWVTSSQMDVRIL